MAELAGFDLSQWQAGAYSGGGGFAFGLAKLTEGVGYKDPAADRHMAAILAQPIVPGGYHFGRADLNPGTSGAYAEADWFWAVASSYGGSRGMLLALDAESAGGSLQWCSDFLGRLAWRLGGYNALFYSYWAWMQSRGIQGSDLLGRNALWLAWPATNGAFPGVSVSMQQYGLASVPGIQGSVDLDRFFGDAGQLAALTVGGASVTPDEINAVATATAAALGNPQSQGGSGGVWFQVSDLYNRTLNAGMTGSVVSMLAALLADAGAEQAGIDAIKANGAAATSVAALATKLDAVLAGLPTDAAAAVQADVDAAKAELAALGKHLGVDVTTGTDT